MIEVKNLNQGYGKSMIFKDFSISLATHEITSIVGASGCGKSTFLKILAGLVQYKSGSVRGMDKNSFSYVFQEDRLLPWLNGEENIRLVLNQSKKTEEIMGEVLELLEITHSRKMSISEMSGGMQRRIAIARALCYTKLKRGQLLLMDEPFKGLDHKLHQRVIERLGENWRKYGNTVVLVTHNLQEATQISHRVIEFYGTPVKWQFISEQ